MSERLDADRIQAESEARAGLDDPDRGLFRENLRHLVDSINEEASLTPAGVVEARSELVTSICQRLESVRWIREFPEISRETIAAPLFLTGLPRSGTTYFQKLFDMDPALRLVRVWEALRPCPPPGFDPESASRRLEEARRFNLERERTMPGFNAVHLSDADGPEECHWLLTQTIGAIGYFNAMNVPAYCDYLLSELNLGVTYQHHRRQLQLLQWLLPRRRWALKYPNHLIALDVIIDLYPDARLLVTHRDPRQTLASICKATQVFRAGRSAARDAKVVGRQMRRFVRQHIDRLLAFHASPAAGRAIHVDYYRILRDPAAVFAEIYATLGLTLTPEVGRAIAEWRRLNPKNKRGANDYSLADFGIDAGEVAEEYADYIETFDIPSEQQGLARGAP